MADNAPLVTIAIPTFNRATYLAQALRSALNQSHRNIEILVSDNASTDATASVVCDMADPRIRYLRQASNLGMMPNWNACLQEARGSYFLMLSDDDLLDDDAVASLLEPLRAGYEGQPADTIGLVYGRARLIDSDGRQTDVGKPAPPIEAFSSLASNFFRTLRPTYPCAILLRTADAREVGGYPGEQFPLAADAALWMKVGARRGWAVFVNRPLVSYRSHSTSVTRLAKVEQWLADNNGLASLALSLMPPHAAASQEEGLQRALRQLNARVVCDLTYTAYLQGATGRAGVLSAVARHARLFNDPVSIRHLFRILVRLAVPKKAIECLREIRNRRLISSE